MFSQVIGGLGTCSDLFGPIRMRSDNFGCVRKRQEAFENFCKLVDLFSGFGKFSLLQGRVSTCSGVLFGCDQMHPEAF